VRVEGHTDNQRSERFDNLKLSQLRADAVRDYLVAHGVATGHLRTRGYGDEKPIAPNDNDEGREKNRRVEFVITR
jgi:outer membrane protein OmpA-like peptidoglycan-associated protein